MNKGKKTKAYGSKERFVGSMQVCLKHLWKDKILQIFVHVSHLSTKLNAS